MKCTFIHKDYGDHVIEFCCVHKDCYSKPRIIRGKKTKEIQEILRKSQR